MPTILVDSRTDGCRTYPDPAVFSRPKPRSVCTGKRFLGWWPVTALKGRQVENPRCESLRISSFPSGYRSQRRWIADPERWVSHFSDFDRCFFRQKSACSMTLFGCGVKPTVSQTPPKELRSASLAEWTSSDRPTSFHKFLWGDLSGAIRGWAIDLSRQTLSTSPKNHKADITLISNRDGCEMVMCFTNPEKKGTSIPTPGYSPCSPFRIKSSKRVRIRSRMVYLKV